MTHDKKTSEVQNDNGQSDIEWDEDLPDAKDILLAELRRMKKAGVVFHSADDSDPAPQQTDRGGLQQSRGVPSPGYSMFNSKQRFGGR